MQLPELTPEDRAALKSQHGHRFPELFYFTKPGDNGEDVRLPVVLGIPTGAADMPKGAYVSKMWNSAVQAIISKDRSFDDGPLVDDAVLWPSPVVWDEWCTRWPALRSSVIPTLREKTGFSLALAEEPERTGAMPDAIMAALSEHAGASRLRFKPAAAELVIKAPSATTWVMFQRALDEKPEDAWKNALELGQSSIAASTVPASGMLARWPGLAILVMKKVAYLAGAAQAVQQGEL